MTQRERRNRKDQAIAASARFAELESLLREQAQLRVWGPVMLSDPDLSLPDGMDRADLRAWLTARLASLAGRIDAYKDDDALVTLAEATLAISVAD